MKTKLTAVVIAAVSALACLIVLYWGNNIGLADNGDYRRVMEENRITYLEAENNTYMFRQYYNMEVTGTGFFQQLKSLFHSGGDGFYTSPHQEVVRFSKVLNFFYNKVTQQNVNHYNILWLAVIYVFMFAHGVYFLAAYFKKIWQQIVIAGVVLFFFCDAGYLLYFNSFFGEALQYVSVFMLCALALHLIRTPKSYGKLVLFFLYLYLFAGAKLVNIPTALLTAVSMLLLLCKEHGKGYRCVLGGLVAASVVACALLYADIPDWMDRDTNYQAVFYGILKDSDTPEEDLEELGLNPEYAVLANTNAYMPEYPIDVSGEAFESGFHEQISKFKVAAFYLAHPVRLTQKLAIAIENSAHIRPTYLGTSSVYRVEQTNRWSGWSNLRVYSNVLYTPVIVLPFLLLFSIAVLFAVFRAGKDADKLLPRVFLLLLMAALWINLAVQIIGNGEADLAKHMFLFIQLFDILLVWGLLWCVFNWKTVWAHKRISGGVVLAAAVLVTGAVYKKPPQTMEFGAWDGKPIQWDVVSDEGDGTVQLISHEILTEMEFDGEGVYGKNLWRDADIREWLNTDFLQAFSAEERERLVPVRQRMLLSAPNQALAEGGNHLHFWTPVPQHSADLADTAYFYTPEDLVYLPTIEQVTEIRGRVGGAFWLSTPYAAEGAMVRQVEPDGFVLRKDANRQSGVRPVICIKKEP